MIRKLIPGAVALGLIATLLFLSLNGHLLTLSMLAESFTLLPISATPFAAKGFAAMLSWAATIFSTGVFLALPLIALGLASCGDSSTSIATHPVGGTLVGLVQGNNIQRGALQKISKTQNSVHRSTDLV